MWGNTYESTLKPLVLLQKRAMRVMTFSKYDEHTSPLFKNLGLLKLSDLIIFSNLLFMHDFCTNNLPDVFANFFMHVNQLHNYNTRLASKNTYCIPSIRTNYVKFSLRFQGPKIWNNLEDSLKSLTRIAFKHKLKIKLINEY